MKLKFIPAILTSLVMILIIVPYPSTAQGQEERPNILWLVSEDNSPFVGAYGDDFATTPNLDQLASEGFMYTNAYANAPVCAPSRNTIITGVYANSGGNQHHRSNYEVSSIINFFPRLLREAGYYTTNNAKEDYNIATDQTRDIWDESSEEAHYSNRDWGQPFFAVFNTMKSHESTIHNRKSVEDLRHNPQKAMLATEDDIPLLKSFLKSDDSAIRYWGATGLLILGEYAKPAIAQLKAALNDSSPSVVVIAAEALYNISGKVNMDPERITPSGQSSISGSEVEFGVRTVDSYLHRSEFELYDIREDPFEAKNLAGDPAYAEVLEEYTERIRGFQMDTGDPWYIHWVYKDGPGHFFE